MSLGKETEMHINKKNTNEKGPTVNDLPFQEGFKSVHPIVDRSYLETSYVDSETWAHPPPVALPHFTWMTGVQARWT